MVGKCGNQLYDISLYRVNTRYSIISSHSMILWSCRKYRFVSSRSVVLCRYDIHDHYTTTASVSSLGGDPNIGGGK
jgi:hypothetical protein